MERTRTAVVLSVLAVSIAALSPARAQSDARNGQSHGGTGTVKSVDVEKGTVSLAHRPIESLSWPAMTMTFKAKDTAVLKNAKPGAKVAFSFIQSGKDFVVTDIK